MKAVARVFHFPPSEIASLSIDGGEEDFLGLEFWYQDAKAYDNEIKKSIKGKK